MHDGSIRHDVQKRIGVAATSKETKLFAPEGSIEDDLQSVSAKMSLDDEKPAVKPSKRKKRKTVRKPKARRKN